MTRGRISIPTAAALALALPLPQGQVRASEPESFVTAQGRRVSLSPVSEMSCPELRSKLSEIDATGYRGLRPAPRDSRDSRLLAYEIDVSRRYYSRCGRGGDSPDASEVLRQGFAAAPADGE